MLTCLRVHLQLIVLPGTVKLHLNIFLFKRTVVQANKNHCVITHFFCMEEEGADAI